MAQLVRMIIQRILMLVPLLLGIILFVFIVMQFSGGDPAIAALADRNPTEAELEAFRVENGLNDPLIVQYFRFIGNLLQGDMGNSLQNGQAVSEIVGMALPLTIQLTVLGALITIVVSFVLGVIAALYRDRWPDNLIRMISLIGVAAPSFWVALILIQAFAINTKVFPTGGYVNPADGFGEFLRYLALPAVSLAIPLSAQMTRIVRTSMVEELDKDYVRTAVGNGLPRIVVVGRNVLRNALINPLTVLGLRIGYLLGGAVVIEATFTLPGMGQKMIYAVTNSDPFVVQGVVIVIATGFVIVNLIVDILYLIVNPRMRSAAA
ncbi:ABC transporter permease [Micrococcales bacterium 31B]|nr:ABC transporter permease [Micrococcales bacterium 31B]